MTYDLFQLGEKALKSRRLAGVLEECTTQLVRCDERLYRAEPAFQQGFNERLNYFEAQGLVGLQGSLVHLEDLVLYDLQSLWRIPDEDVHLGAAALALRRWLDKQRGRNLLGADALERVTGIASLEKASNENVEDALLRSLIDDVDRAMKGEARSRQRSLTDDLAALESLPIMLAAVLLLDYFLSGAIAAKKGAGFVLCGAYLRARGLVSHHLPAVTRAAWRGRYRHQSDWEFERRLMALAQVVSQSARLAMDDMNRLLLARATMMAKAARLRQGSRLPDLIELFMAHPALSIDVMAAKLKVTPQAVEHMLNKQLAGTRPAALSEHKRYRTFGIL
jgi:Protein of unknown function (DUF1612)/HTH DNA binding domain